MRQLFAFLFFLSFAGLFGCDKSPTGPNAGQWKQVTANAPWGARHFFSGTVYNNSMWVMGGLYSNNCPTTTLIYGDVWSSGNGSSWSLANANAPWGARFGHRILSFNGRMYLIGGNNNGLRNDVWTSTDGVVWTNILVDANPPAPNQFTHRMDFGAEVFNNAMWIIGGWDGQSRNDVWNSLDGITWNLVLANNSTPGPARFNPRWGHSTAVHNNNLWLVAGASGTLGQSNFQRHNDVWTSPDGINWTMLNNTLSGVRYQQTVAHNGLIWMTGGWGVYGSRNTVGNTPDGISWTYDTKAPFDPRFYHLSLSFLGSLWVMGGMNNNGACNFFNDVWRLP